MTAPDGTRVVTDPFASGYPSYLAFPPDLKADIVTISHGHRDHNADYLVRGNPVIINTPTAKQIGMIQAAGYPSLHGNDADDKSLGDNIIFRFTIGRVNIVHLGELGRITDPEKDMPAIMNCDVLIVPVGIIGAMPFVRGYPGQVITRMRDAIVPTWTMSIASFYDFADFLDHLVRRFIIATVHVV